MDSCFFFPNNAQALETRVTKCSKPHALEIEENTNSGHHPWGKRVVMFRYIDAYYLSNMKNDK